VTSAANNRGRTRARFVLFALLYTHAWVPSSVAQDYLQIQIEGSLTPEMRAALARVIDPATDHDSLFRAFQQSFNANTLANELTLGANSIDLYGRPTWPSPEIGIEQTLTAPVAVLDAVPENLNEMLFSSDDKSGAGDIELAFILTGRDSNLARAYGGMLTETSDIDPGMQGGLGIAAPISASNLARINNLGVINQGNVTQFSPRTQVVLNSSAVEALSLIDRDLERLDVSARGVRISPNVPDEALAALNEAFVNAGQSLPERRSSPNDILMEVLPGEVIQTATGGSCGQDPNSWPIGVDAVRAVIDANLATLTTMGIRYLPRTQIMVIDSGLPTVLAEHSDFEPFLHRFQSAQLSLGEYIVGADLKADCNQRDRHPYASVFGYVVESARGDNCINRSPYLEIAPPNLDPVPANYVWDHGGFVGVLAAGGPALIANSPAHERLLGISFARVMRDEGSKIRSEAMDIKEAFEFATKKRIPIVNASLRVDQKFRDIIVDAFDDYKDGGLLIAAAGNTMRELEAASATFPAVVASPDPNDNLIIVGGVQPSADGSDGVDIWPDGSFSPFLVDIAAPASGVASLDGNGELACYAGTSVAAPQVSFTAGLLLAFGLTTPAEIKRRILATADIHPDMGDRIRDGRVLNVEAALNVFSDLIWRNGQIRPETVRLLPPVPNLQSPLLKVCSDDARTLPKGWIDASRLHLWERQPDGTARIWHDISGGITNLNETCAIEETRMIRFLTSDGADESASLSDLARIVPSRLRNALAAFPGSAQ
jgi:hypothetical protein